MTGGNIGVVIPCRNVASFVGEALSSLSASRTEVSSVVCVDDGSTDVTLEVIRRVSADANLSVKVVQAGGVGAGAARNLGLAEIDAPYCQFLDADDLLLPGKLERQLRLAEKADADVVAGAYILRSIDGTERQVDVADDTWSGLLTSRLGSTSAMLFRSDAVRAAGGWSESLQSSQEYDLIFRMVKSGSSTTSDHEPHTVKNERPDAISSGDPAPRLERFVELRSRMLTHLGSTNQLTSPLEEDALNTMFRSIQKIGETDNALAVSLFDKHLPSDFTPSGSSLFTRAYSSVFTVLGFERTETIRRKIDGLRG